MEREAQQQGIVIAGGCVELGVQVHDVQLRGGREERRAHQRVVQELGIAVEDEGVVLGRGKQQLRE